MTIQSFVETQNVFNIIFVGALVGTAAKLTWRRFKTDKQIEDLRSRVTRVEALLDLKK